MAVTTGQQLSGTWLTWKAFHLPHETGSTWAYAVPTKAGNKISVGYSLLLDILIGQFFCLAFGLFIVIFLRKKKKANKVVLTHFPDLLPYVWSSKTDLLGAFWDKVGELWHFKSEASEKHASANSASENRAGFFPLSSTLIVMLALFTGQKAMSILVSAKVIIDNVAPVDPKAIYLPDISSQDNNSIVDARYVLEVPWALRAFGTATASNSSLSKHVKVSQEILIGTFNGSQIPVYQVTYSYRVTGADLGLQKHPELTLSVNGSCFTEYNWYLGSSYADSGDCVPADVYAVFGNSDNQIRASALDGPAPIATFQIGGYSLPGTLSDSNNTWAAIISSAGKLSYTSGTDPWYLTGQLDANSSVYNTTGADYVVANGRPALSCWEDDVWSYKGHKASIHNLDSLPGLDMSPGMLSILKHYLAVPIVVEMSIRLGASALITAALGSIIDASTKSFAQDLSRLVVAAYVATTNVLTTTTSYPKEASTRVPNAIRNTSGAVAAGAADFVVKTPDAAALNLAIIIAIPILVFVFFVLNTILFSATPLVTADGLGAVRLFSKFVMPNRDSTLEYSRKGGLKWDLPENPGPQERSKTSGTETVNEI